MLLAGAGVGASAVAEGRFLMLNRLALSTALAALLVIPAALAEQGPPIAGSVENFSRIDPSLPAPDDDFTDISGHSLSLDDFRGKMLLINL
jgi:hypothetical protein